MRDIVQASGTRCSEIKPASYGWNFAAGAAGAFVRVCGGMVKDASETWFVSAGRELSVFAVLPTNWSKAANIFKEEERIYELIKSATEKHDEIKIVCESEDNFP